MQSKHFLAAIVVMISCTAVADDFTPTESISARSQLDLLPRIERLQQEVLNLHGALDERQHEIKKLNERLQSMYVDLDQRISASTKSSASMSHGGAMISGVSHENDVAEQALYNAAYELIKQRQYREAANSMQRYVQHYGQGRFAANAHYWLGELHLLEGESNKAISEFEIVIKQYADSNKIPDSLLKLGVLYHNRGEITHARENFNRVIKLFPDSSAARLAQSKLEKMTVQ